ncbi:DUF1176 domain-containing protein [Sphingomonas sp.]
MTRTLFPLALAILATGCNAPPPFAENAMPANVAIAQETPDPAMDAAVAPRPGELKTFRDWTVGCDNVGGCKAVALAPEEAMDDWPAFLPAIERDPGRPGLVRLSFTGQADATPPITLTLDGRQIARGGSTDGIFEGSDARRIAEAMAQGQRLRIDSNGVTAAISLSGLAAALRYLDDVQGRDGSPGALVEKGNGNDNSAAGPLPMIRALSPSGDAAPLPSDLVARLQRQAGCELYEGAPVLESSSHALGGGATLALIACGAGAYNIVTAPFVLTAGADWRPAPIDAPSGFGEDGSSPMLVNADFADGVLTTYAKGRGLGDCGVTQAFVWDGTRLRLSEQTEMRECRGNVDYITTWRTRVVRR